MQTRHKFREADYISVRRWTNETNWIKLTAAGLLVFKSRSASAASGVSQAVAHPAR